ncbi:MAG TPA: carboxypeptidase-like regulatory domain-containing protein, partial [Thermoanaerobaculia bacterium]|nr:carboxypeptidase-like regulatory domain-containing protein [Thermoanaerobaculia bacterium]
MSLIARAVLACLFVSLSTFAAAAATVSGTVSDAASKALLGGMVVAAYDTTGALRGSATTDSAGLYVLTIPAGDYRVLAYDPAGNYATMFDANAESFETSPVRSIGNSGAMIHFALVRGGTITGRVANASGVARPGATVEAYNLSGTRRGFTTADALGNYTLVLPPGQFKIVAYDTGFGALFYPGVRTFAEAARVTVTAAVATANVHFQLSVAARASGTVVDLATRQPLPGIDVYAYDPAGREVARTMTDANGAFALSLPNGTYRFVAADPDHVYATAFFDAGNAFENASIVTLAAGEQRANVQFALVRG